MSNTKKLAKLKRRMKQLKAKKNRKPKFNRDAINEPRAVRDKHGWLTGIQFPVSWTQEQKRENWDHYLAKFMAEDSEKWEAEEEKFWRDVYNDPMIQKVEQFLAEARAASEFGEEEA